MKKIGIFGGTFNPIHNGHLILAETARQTCGLDQVLLIPSGHSYMKNPDDILPGGIRLEMVRLAVRDNPFFSESDVEVMRGGNSYTCETLELLEKENPGAELYYIVGADTLFQIESWKDPADIFRRCVIIAAVRDGWQDETLQNQAAYLMRKFSADIHLLPSLHIEISATDIRKKCSQGQSVRYLVPEAVRLFLEQNGYYR